jgi:RNA polymerase sigma-70 factor, ECF subfamily
VRGLTLIDAVGASGALDQYHLFHAARADMLRRLGQRECASKAYRRALDLTTNAVERGYLERRLVALTGSAE